MARVFYLLLSLCFIKTEEDEASTKTYTQQLLFDYDHTIKEHYCDVKLEPSDTVREVMIFARTDGEFGAVPKSAEEPSASTMNPSYFRTSIPDDLEKDGSEYSFKFIFDDNTHVFSENWVYDSDKNKFSLKSAVKTNFFKSKWFYGLLAAGAVVALIAAINMRKVFKRKSAASM